jgi:hypothetical protein
MRRWLTFGIRDLLWAIVVLGLVVAWWVDRRQLARKNRDLHEFVTVAEAEGWKFSVEHHSDGTTTYHANDLGPDSLWRHKP